MSGLASEALGSSVTGGVMTGGGGGGGGSSTLLPTVTRVDARTDVNPVSVVLAVSIVFILAPITISSNTMILAAFYRYKRLRTASNFLLASLAVSDFGVGVFMPFGMHLEMSGLAEDARISTLCIVPYCIVIALCSVSVLVTVAIAVDRLTSLAQPLRYKNIITHSSVEKYIAVFWLYAIGVGFSPLIYARTMGLTQPHSGSCRFGAAVVEPVRVFLVVAVWAPSALVLIGCYMYVYLVARAHARAIYTVELSFRHQTQTLALPRYGQTLALTVGAFFILWLPFQACMLLDILWGTKILTDWRVVWLGLPILGHSGANPWIYAFHHGEMRVAATKIAEDVVTRFGIHPSRYGCSPVVRRNNSNTNYELGEVNNKSNDNNRRPPIEDCFAAKNHQNSYLPRIVDKTNKCDIEAIENSDQVSPELRNSTRRFSGESLTADDIIDETNIHDLTNMLKPEYAIDRNNLIDSNHNIDKIKNLKYLIDPTLNKIRNLRKFTNNSGKRSCLKNFTRIDEQKYISYQNLMTDNGSNESHGSNGSNVKTCKINTMSDPLLNAQISRITHTESHDLRRVPYVDSTSFEGRDKCWNITSMSDPNIKCGGNSNASGTTGKIVKLSPCMALQCRHRCSVHSLDDASRSDRDIPRQIIQCRPIDRLKKSDFPGGRTSFHGNFDITENHGDSRIKRIVDNSITNPSIIPGAAAATATALSITVTTNKLANIFHPNERRIENFAESRVARSGRQPQLNRKKMRHSESISAIVRATRSRLIEPSRFMRMDSLAVPTIHSEPPSPIEPLAGDAALESLVDERSSGQMPNGHRSPIIDDNVGNCDFHATRRRERAVDGTRTRTPSARMSDPIIPFVSLNMDDFNSTTYRREKTNDSRNDPCFSIVPEELAEALLASNCEKRTTEEQRRPSGTIFVEHDSTRFSSRRPSDLRWSESSRSQEVLSYVNEHKKSPSSYSVNNFDARDNSGSDLNDVTCLGSFVCPDALTSSLRESFFEAPSVPDSDVFTSFEDMENRDDDDVDDDDDDDAASSSSPTNVHDKLWALPLVHSSVSVVNLGLGKKIKINGDPDDRNNQSKSTESVMKNHRAILRLESTVHRNRFRVRPGKDCIIVDTPLIAKTRMAPLATPTPIDISTPTFDVATEIKATVTGMGVRV